MERRPWGRQGRARAPGAPQGDTGRLRARDAGAGRRRARREIGQPAAAERRRRAPSRSGKPEEGEIGEGERLGLLFLFANLGYWANRPRREGMWMVLSQA